jgi:hypothetical protein
MTNIRFVRASWWKNKKQQGLWLCAPGAEPKLIVEGDYSAPLVTPDGNYLVAVRNGALVRIDIRGKPAPKVETDHVNDLPTLVPGSGNVYFQVRRGEQTEHMILDPASGKLESEAMWVDEAAKRIYLTYNGHLLRLPLVVDQKSSNK